MKKNFHHSFDANSENVQSYTFSPIHSEWLTALEHPYQKSMVGGVPVL